MPSDVLDWVRYRVCVQVYKCLHNMVPGYLSTLCQPMSRVPGRRHLCSARRSKLDFPPVNLATYWERAFAYTGPTSWNSLPDSLENINLTLQIAKCKPSNAISRPICFPHTSTLSAFEVPYKNLLLVKLVKFFSKFSNIICYQMDF